MVSVFARRPTSKSLKVLTFKISPFFLKISCCPVHDTKLHWSSFLLTQADRRCKCIPQPLDRKSVIWCNMTKDETCLEHDPTSGMRVMVFFLHLIFFSQRIKLKKTSRGETAGTLLRFLTLISHSFLF